MFNIRKIYLDKFNSMTKYPPIPTYHTMAKGKLLDEVRVQFTGRVIGTEKVDGINARIIFCPDQSVLVGSREDLLWERTDLIHNPAMGIVDCLKDKVHALERKLIDLCLPDRIMVFYGEVFGHGIGNSAKNYTKSNQVDFRLFDVAFINNFDEILSRPLEGISFWRHRSCSRFASETDIAEIAAHTGFRCVPSLFAMDASMLPTDIEDTYAFLHHYDTCWCKLDTEADGIPEGIVVRTSNRSRIAKLRREDYANTLRKPERKRKGSS